jgi:hypothetical protein
LKQVVHELAENQHLIPLDEDFRRLEVRMQVQ